VLVHEPSQWAGREEHDPDRDDDRRDHDRQLVDHADRREHGIEREHDVEQDDLDDDRPEGGAGLAPALGVVGRLALQRLEDLGRGLPEQEQAAADEDQVSPRELDAGDREHRRGQADDPRDGQQQQDAHAHREPQADVAGAVALARRQLADEDRDEDDVVDAEHDLEHRQRQQGDPGLGVRQQVHAVQGTGRNASDPAVAPQGDTRLLGGSVGTGFVAPDEEPRARLRHTPTQ
jgi:hypothetical protein